MLHLQVHPSNHKREKFPRDCGQCMLRDSLTTNECWLYINAIRLTLNCSQIVIRNPSLVHECWCFMKKLQHLTYLAINFLTHPLCTSCPEYTIILVHSLGMAIISHL